MTRALEMYLPVPDKQDKGANFTCVFVSFLGAMSAVW
jgi:hypothetical protein